MVVMLVSKQVNSVTIWAGDASLPAALYNGCKLAADWTGTLVDIPRKDVTGISCHTVVLCSEPGEADFRRNAQASSGGVMRVVMMIMMTTAA